MCTVGRALRALPVDQRSAIVLVDVEGLSVAEAADVLGVPEGTVKSRCSRGRAKLAVALAGLRNPDLGITSPNDSPGGRNPSASSGVPSSPDPSPDQTGTGPPGPPRPSPEVTP